MLGLLLFISALAVLIICARMHDCHVDTVGLWVRDSDTNYRERKNALKTCQANNMQARSIVCIAHLKGSLVIDDWEPVSMYDYQMSHGRGILWLWAMNSPRTAAPYGEDVSKRKKESNKSIPNIMSKMYTECS